MRVSLNFLIVDFKYFHLHIQIKRIVQLPMDDFDFDFLFRFLFLFIGLSEIRVFEISIPPRKAAKRLRNCQQLIISFSLLEK